MKTLAIIPARGGSKGLPGKNWRDFMGKPAVLWAIECGRRTCDRVCVTSDEPIVLEIAEKVGVVAIQRPFELAQDDNPILQVICHVLEKEREFAPDLIALLQPTQPLRRDEHVKQALDLIGANRDADSVVSIVELPRHYLPDKCVIVVDRHLQSFLGHDLYSTRRWQDCRPAFYRDGTIYLMKTKLLESGEMFGRVLPLIVSSQDSCTIDTEEDWLIGEMKWRQRAH